ncbi:hypothetical protein N0O92_03740 [Alkalihalobacillus sp. MEB130]|uniref:NAD(P)-binding domain-containing protein n=1 Tax=Alkalihalobacillus sp. MEB130 TaxID=2976704 RepID=UPI0028DEF08F|nr:NAD(P)-binding domain-containing protein [Alkalihalobacillus sp. MEB130]MDT8859333.1 hypothetical protein [Alkalihalobacillus sp. MEB130]
MKIIVGSGRLASMLLTVLKKGENMYVFGRNEQTVDSLLQQFSYVEKATPQDLSKATELFLCLPKSGYSDFLQRFARSLRNDVTIFHMATVVNEEEVKSLSDNKKVVPLKLAGHAKIVKREARGLFVLAPHHKEEQSRLREWFPTMQIELAEESTVLLANQLATEAAIQMSVLLSKEMTAHQIPTAIQKQTFDQTVHGVIDAYQSNDLGGFARKIAEQLKEKGGERNENG